MKSYDKMGRAELIKRLKALEAKPAGRAGERALTQAALRESEERLRAILQTAVEGIITIDERGIMESLNPAAERIFGYRASELVGRNVSILMPSPYRQAHDGYMSNYKRTGHARIIGIGREVVGQRKDGSVFPMDLSVSEVKLADKRLFTGFVRDVTDRKRLEKEILEISELEQQRIGQDLHDGLCQQLAGIELMSQALEQRLGAKSRADAVRAGEIARHVRESIAHTRSLARGLSPVELDAKGLMSALQEMAANVEKIFGIQCVFRCGAPVLIHDNAVATHLFRIAQEAVSNSIKHGKATRIEIGLTALPERIMVAVRDNGAGFPKVPGRGMGLRIMNYRAGVIGGSLAIQKEESGGTTVVCSVRRSARNSSTARKA